MNAPLLNGGIVAGTLAEDSATPSLSLQQIFSFTDTSSSSGPDFQGLNIVNAPNGIGTLTATLLDEATGLGGDTTGSVQWSYSVANAAVQYLAAGETRVMEYRIEVIDLDGNTLSQPITITITGTNDAPVITTAAPTHGFGEDAATLLTVTSSLAFTDVDSIDTHTVSVTAVFASGQMQGLSLGPTALQALLSTTISTTAGTAPAGATGQIGYTFSANSSAFQYLAQGEVLTLNYLLVLSDGKGGTATRDVVITVTGANDAPVLTAVSGSYTDTAADDSFADLTGSLVATDVDVSDTLTFGIAESAPSTENGYDVAKASTYGTLHVNATTGAYKFIPDDAAIEGLKGNATVTFTVTVADGKGGTDSKDVTITLTGANDTAVVTGDISGSVTEDGTTPGTAVFIGDLGHTDRDAADADDTWNVVANASGAYGTFTLAADGQWSYTLNNNHPAVQALNVGQTLIDSPTIFTSGATPQQISVTINGANDASVSLGSSGTVGEAGGC